MNDYESTPAEKPILNGSVITYLIMGGALLTWIIVGNSPSHKITCVDETIPYTSSTVDDPTSLVGTSVVTTDGVNGTRHVCKTGKGVVKENSVTTDPTNEIVSQGTEQPAPLYTPPVQSTGCVVTTCADGTCSFSTGRGTCSWHGGEAY